MKKFVLIFIAAVLFSACDEKEVSQMLETVNKIAETAENVKVPSTGIGQLDAAISDEKAKALYTNRKITVLNAFNSDTIWHFEGRARISEKSTNGDVTIHYIDEDGKPKKRDFLGSTMNIISEQL